MVEVERRLQPRRRHRRRNDDGENEEFDGDEFDEQDEQEVVDHNRRYCELYREYGATIFGGDARRNIRMVDNREDSSLGSIKMKISSF